MFTPTRYRAHSGPEAYLYRRMIAAMALALATGAALLPARAPAQPAMWHSWPCRIVNSVR